MTPKLLVECVFLFYAMHVITHPMGWPSPQVNHRGMRPGFWAALLYSAVFLLFIAPLLLSALSLAPFLLLPFIDTAASATAVLVALLVV